MNPSLTEHFLPAFQISHEQRRRPICYSPPPPIEIGITIVFIINGDSGRQMKRRGKGWGSLFIPDVVHAYITYGILHDDADVLEDEDDDGIATESETAR